MSMVRLTYLKSITQPLSLCACHTKTLLKSDLSLEVQPRYACYSSIICYPLGNALKGDGNPDDYYALYERFNKP